MVQQSDASQPSHTLIGRIQSFLPGTPVSSHSPDSSSSPCFSPLGKLRAALGYDTIQSTSSTSSLRQNSRVATLQTRRMLMFPLMGRRFSARCDELLPSDDVPPPSVETTPPILATPPPPPPTYALQFENYQKEWQQLSQQDTFDGFRVEATKQVTQQLQASHTLFLGTTMRPEGYLYQFGPVYTFDNNQSVALARIGTDGAVNTRFVKKVGPQSEIRLHHGSHLKEEERNMVEVAGEHSGKDYAAQLKVAYQGAMIINGAFSKAVTERLQLGTELTYVSAGASIGVLGGRFSDGKNSATLQVTRAPQFSKGPAGFALSEHSVKSTFVRKVSDRLSLGCECEMRTPDIGSEMRLGYEYNFRQARVQGLLDTGGKASVFVQDFSGFGVSGLADWKEGIYKFGFVMHIMPPQE